MLHYVMTTKTRSSTLTISHLQLSNLTLENWYRTSKAVNVVAPQLKNLSIRNCGGEHRVSAPNLTSLNPSEAVAHKLVGLLHKFNNVKYLELSLEIIELLSATVNLLLHQPSPFVHLTRLRILPLIFEEEGRGGRTHERNAHRAVRDAILAGNLMEKLRVLLDKEKASMKCSNENRMQQPWMEMPPGVSQTQAQMKCYNENRMQQPWMKMPSAVSQIQALMKSYWSEQRSQIDQEEAKCEPIFSLLVRIN
nr:hypothetical protein [Tanacetum cinerariifolium]